MSPTARELECWYAYLETGSTRDASLKVGCHVQTIKRHLAALREFYGVRTLAQLAVVMHADRTARPFMAVVHEQTDAHAT